MASAHEHAKFDLEDLLHMNDSLKQRRRNAFEVSIERRARPAPFQIHINAARNFLAT
jgi:hypothetical protein